MYSGLYSVLYEYIHVYILVRHFFNYIIIINKRSLTILEIILLYKFKMLIMYYKNRSYRCYIKLYNIQFSSLS